MKQHRPLKFCSTLILLFLAGAGCDTRMPPVPATKTILQAFADGTQAANPVKVVAREPRRMYLYVDTSGSMKGFVNRLGSDYSRVLSYLLERSATAGYDLSVFGFSRLISAPLGNISAASVLKPSFYDGGETSFPDVFERITMNHDASAISIVVSDFVQSGRTGDQRSLIIAFQKLARKHPGVLLLTFRSSFEGQYFVEGARAGTSYRLALDGTTAERSRPFYALVIAPSPADLNETRKVLLQGLHGYEEFDASSPGVKLIDVEYLLPGDGTAPVWNVYKPKESLSTGQLSAPRDLLSFLEIAPPSGEKSLLRLRFKLGDVKASNANGFWSPRDVSCSVHRRKQRETQWQPIEEMDVNPEPLLSADGNYLTVSYNLPRPDPYSWDLYRVRLLPGAGNLRLPTWVEEWTTLDDSLPIWGNRTFKLELFVEAMTRSLREQIPISEHYLLLGRGE